MTRPPCRRSNSRPAVPYGWVRHPIYSGWFLIVFAVPVMTLTRLVFAVTSSAYLLIAIPFEERSLRRSSQGAYDQLCARSDGGWFRRLLLRNAA